MNQLRLPSRVSAEDAVSWFARPRLRNAFGRFARRAHLAQPRHAAPKPLPFIERVWMPAYTILLHATAGQREQSLWTSVDGSTGQFAIFECVDLLERSTPDEPWYEPAINANEAEAIARKCLLQYVMRMRGRFRKPVVDAVEEMKCYYYPVWLLYFRRRRGTLDVKTMDAFSGKDGGPKLRVAVLNAMVQARRHASHRDEN